MTPPDAVAAGSAATLPVGRVPDAHARSGTEVARALAVDPGRGLSSQEASNRIAREGANVVQVAERHAIWRLLLDAATEPFVLLLIAAGVGAILLGETRDGWLILVGLVPIVGADVVTEYRGERALEALRAASAPRARVRRDAEVAEIPAAAIALGDVVLLRTGDVVPADLRLTRAERLLIDRSVLTGESVPEPAAVEPDAGDAPLADRRSVACSGTSVVGGRGEGIVVATGPWTEVGRIAAGLVSKERRRSPLQAELDRLVRILLVVALGLIGVTAGLGFVRGNSVGENLLAGISAAIAAIPEEPPILLAVILGLGAFRLLRRGVLVRRLNAEEVLGAVDLVITDKTGTLTRSRLEVASVTRLDGSVIDPAARLPVLEDALRAEDDAWGHAEGIGVSSFTAALRRAVEDLGGDARPDPADLVAAEAVDDRRPVTSTTARRAGGIETLTLGAPEVVIDEVVGPDEPTRAAWLGRLAEAVAAGQRVLGLARRDGAGSAMVALVGFADPIRPGIPEAAEAARAAGIQVIVVTGDHPVTAAAIAHDAGLVEGATVTGADVDTLSDHDLVAQLAGIAVVARATAEQKARIVRVARAGGRLVAVTGDGVNDAPALHAADVAVAMGGGTAVAKEAADLVLGDDSFATLIYGIGEGRRIVDNVQKGLVFLVSTHVALLGFILAATLVGFDRPLLPIQILWLELFIDITASAAFEREPAEPDLMRRAPRPQGRPLLPASLLARIALAGGFSAVAALWLMVGRGAGADHLRWMAYTTLVCAQAVRAYANRSLRAPLRSLRWNPILAGAAIATVVVQVLMPHVGPLRTAFGAVPLAPGEWAAVALIAIAPAVLAEAARRRRRTWVA